MIVRKSLDNIFQGAVNGIKQWLCHILPAALFALFMIVGYSFFKTGSSSLLIANGYQIIKSSIVFSGYFLLFLFLIVLFYNYLDSLSVSDSTETAFKSLTIWFYKSPVKHSFSVLLFFYIPNIIFSYPAIFMGDSPWQITQGLNLVPLSNHHPITHTLLLKTFTVVGNLISSYNFGIFLYALFQLCFFLMVVSFALNIAHQYCHIKPLLFFSLLLYFIIHPRIQSYMMLITKDVIFTALFLVYLSLSFLMLTQKRIQRYHYVVWILALFGIVLFRNEGIYIVSPMLLFWGCTLSHKKVIVATLLFIVSFFMIWNRVILPGLNVRNGSVRELLSIPFQQTARYVKLVPGKVTLEEKNVINKVLNYKILAKKYNPSIADPVKSSFKEKSTRQERKQYMKTWFAMLKKEPHIYVDALLANKFEYLYLNSNLAINFSYKWSESCMRSTNDRIRIINAKFSYPLFLKDLREKYENIRESTFKLPVLKFFISPAIYIWLLFLLVFYVIKKRLLNAAVLLVPCIMQFFVLIAGPTNGSYFRYVYPLAVWLPFIFIFILNLKELQLQQLLEKEKNGFTK